MGIKSSLISVALLFLFAGLQAQAIIFDVTKLGAKPNGEISKAVLSAWKQACAATTPSQVLIPAGTYSLNAVEFIGPCKAPIELRVNGILKAPVDPAQIPAGKQWITVKYLSHFTLSGTGTFDGQGGLKAWKMNNMNKNKQHKPSGLQYNLSFNFLNNSKITGVTSKDSKNFHSNVIACNNVTIENFHISAPDESPNTDGIHIGWSKNIFIRNTVIKTGDDCISIGDGCENLHIEGVTCGPGHGISVGSLGRTPGEKPVIGVFVKNCTLIKTMNGVRIKTWPNSHPGVVTGMHFEDIRMVDVGNPVLIEQEYCPSNLCTRQKPSLVKISKVTIRNIRGTSTTPVAVKLQCSPATRCDGVEVADINLTYKGNQGPAKQECTNTKPLYLGKQNPPRCAA